MHNRNQEVSKEIHCDNIGWGCGSGYGGGGGGGENPFFPSLLNYGILTRPIAKNRGFVYSTLR